MVWNVSLWVTEMLQMTNKWADEPFSPLIVNKHTHKYPTTNTQNGCDSHYSGNVAATCVCVCADEFQCMEMYAFCCIIVVV